MADVLGFLKKIGGGLQNAGQFIGRKMDEYEGWQRYGPHWKEIEAYNEAMRQKAMQEAANYEQEAEMKRRYMEAQMEYLEALKEKAARPPAPPTAHETWTEREAQSKINADTPGTPEWVQKETTRKKGVVSDMMKWAKDAVDPSTAFPREFADLTPAQQAEIMEEYQNQVRDRALKDAKENKPKESEDRKRWRQLQRTASAPGKDDLGPTQPSRGEVLAEAINRALAEGVNMQEIPLEERMRAAVEASIGRAEAGQRQRMAQPEPPFGGIPEQPQAPGGTTLSDLGQPGQQPQFPEGAPQSAEEAEAKLTQADPAELEATLKVMSDRGMELEAGLAPEIEKAMEAIRAKGTTFEEAEQQYPSLFAAFRKLMQSQMNQMAPVQPMQPGVPQ